MAFDLAPQIAYKAGMRLSDYIRQVGVERFAKDFGVTRRAVTGWMYRERSPRITFAKRIVAETPVTWEGIAQDAEDGSNASTRGLAK